MKYESHPLYLVVAETDQLVSPPLSVPSPFFSCPAQLLALHGPLLSSHNIPPSSLPLPSSLYLGQWWEDASLPTILKYPDDLTPAQAQQVRARPHQRQERERGHWKTDSWCEGKISRGLISIDTCMKAYIIHIYFSLL
jgi:hypothetical protein